MESSKLLVLVAFLGLLLSAGAARLHHQHHHRGQYHNISAVYAFGDSSVDTGNNNMNYVTIYRGNHSPYGVNFPSQNSTGRLSNGKLIVDYLVSSLGLKETLPPFVGSPGEEYQTGVSYAISGTGLDKHTARANFVPTLDQQVNSFQHSIQYMSDKLGEKQAKQIIKDALYVISVGTNDMVDTYYRPLLQFGLMDVSGYHCNLLVRLQNLLEVLYKDGARKFIVLGMPPIGCLPRQVSAISLPNLFHTVLYGHDCVDEQNNDAQNYNMRLKDLISNKNSQVSDIHIEFVDIYDPMIDMIYHADKYGLESTISACCGLLGIPMTGNLCNKFTPRCPNPNRYLFWDGINPTEVANAQLAGLIVRDVIPKFLLALYKLIQNKCISFALTRVYIVN